MLLRCIGGVLSTHLLSASEGAPERGPVGCGCGGEQLQLCYISCSHIVIGPAIISEVLKLLKMFHVPAVKHLPYKISSMIAVR